MRNSFSKQLTALNESAHQKDVKSTVARYTNLQHITKTPLPKSNRLIAYFETLLYLLAYPSNSAEYALVEIEMKRLSSFLKANHTAFSSWLQNTGLPYSSINTKFSHDTIKWLFTNNEFTIEIDSFIDARLLLHEILYITLPACEKHIAATGMENNALMDALLVPKKNRLAFLIAEFSKLDQQPQLKDTLFDQLGMYVHVRSKGGRISKATNRLAANQIFYHDEMLHRFDHREVLFSPLPDPIKLTKVQGHEVIQVVKTTMLLTARETDPTTYMKPDSFRMYTLERGISIALYGMSALRQLPFESYVGYTVFKNGLPVAYGGSWVFGERANFGINIFEPFRKGESGYIMAQLLRVYKNVFGVSYFEVEAYQFGLDNPEGIASGAFWFYYKYGFRPVNKALSKKAQDEAALIKSKKGYRTSYKTLVEFTDSNICLKLGKKTPPSVASITSKITRMIQNSFEGNRALAERICIAEFKSKTGLKRVPPSAFPALSEIALWAKAMDIHDLKDIKLMAKMVSTKSKDLYVYQDLLLTFLSPPPKRSND